ncbi:LysE family translocator [Streptomyces caatingaensis]|uniref:LysE family translocator protein n=1 Tax=Streptomyces caatingaensis TaxID=1678637 RepID=A0A0K9XIZ9_9ACTN|nr:LysE family translocator [Streptomyces caatingaensis]KNB53369.1 LysE family translocator protein [Streptomyces caatingaensis]
MPTAILGFALLSLLVTVSPGPDLLLVLRNCLRGGRRAGSATALGVAAGSLAWGAAAACGLAAALQRWDAAFTVVRLAGAAYLVFLGAQALWAQRRAVALSEERPAPEDAGPPPRAGAAFRQGVLSCLLNPKVGVFFVAVAPQFLPEGASPLWTTLLFGAIDAVIAVTWMLLVAAGADRMMTWLRRPRVHRGLERATGGILVALGLGTAVESA